MKTHWIDWFAGYANGILVYALVGVKAFGQHEWSWMCVFWVFVGVVLLIAVIQAVVKILTGGDDA